jgi:proteic killer suppression protein
MKVLFDKEYLGNLYEKGDSGDKKHRYQPQVVKKYKKVVDLMINSPNILSLVKYNSLHYEKLVGDKAGSSSVRVNDQYRIEFEEIMQDNEIITTICNITDLSNHYQ